MWRPIVRSLVPYRGPALSGPRLGQLSQAIVDRAAQSVVAEADPRVREIIREERSNLAQAAIGGLPFVAGAATAFLATTYLVSDGQTTLKGLGYIGSAGLFTLGAWNILRAAAGPEAPPEPPSEGPGIPFIADAAKQLAQAIVTEAEPRIRMIVEEERGRLGSAAEAALPFAMASAAAFLGTAYLVPSEMKTGKVAGYLASAAAFLVGIWHGLSVVSE